MEHAYRQKYCKGYAPLELTGGKQILCADFTLPADSGFEKEAAAASEVKRLYKSYTGTLRSYAFRKKITKEAMKAAIRLAGERRNEAIRDHEYDRGMVPPLPAVPAEKGKKSAPIFSLQLVIINAIQPYCLPTSEALSLFFTVFILWKSFIEIE